MVSLLVEPFLPETGEPSVMQSHSLPGIPALRTYRQPSGKSLVLSQPELHGETLAKTT